MKKIFILFLAISMILVGCSKKEEIKIKEPIVEDKVEPEIEVVPEFAGLNNIYTESRNINDLELDHVIYDIKENNEAYEGGEYKEVDFALDLLKGYLNSNEEAYNALVMDYKSDDGKLIKADEYTIDRAKESLNFLKETMGISNDDTVYFKLADITYKGKKGSKYATVININGYASSWDGGYYHLINYKVIVYEEDNNLYGIII